MLPEQAAWRGRPARRANATARPGEDAAAAGAEDVDQSSERHACKERKDGFPPDGAGQALPSQAARCGRAARGADVVVHAGKEAESENGEQLAPVRRC